MSIHSERETARLMLCHFILFNPHSDSDDSNSSNSSGEDDEAANTVDFWFKPSKFYHLMK